MDPERLLGAVLMTIFSLIVVVVLTAAAISLFELFGPYTILALIVFGLLTAVFYKGMD